VEPATGGLHIFDAEHPEELGDQIREKFGPPLSEPDSRPIYMHSLKGYICFDPEKVEDLSFEHNP
jgi:hypothetical protein